MNEADWRHLEAALPPADVVIDGQRLVKGDRVRLHPTARGDVFDIALVGQLATVDRIEQDYEGTMHVAVVLDSDPGRAIGPRRPGHRFFFSPAELELVERGATAPDDARTAEVLVAGIGNIFLGDDAFGVEVVQRLGLRALPDGVRVADYGIRGYDLAYALMELGEGDWAILVDACARGEAPGTLYVLEPDADLPPSDTASTLLDAHAMNPMHVLAMARAMGATHLERVRIVGCEPASFGPDQGHMGLSEPVEAAVSQAVLLVESLVARLRLEDRQSPTTSMHREIMR